MEIFSLQPDDFTRNPGLLGERLLGSSDHSMRPGGWQISKQRCDSLSWYLLEAHISFDAYVGTYLRPYARTRPIPSPQMLNISVSDHHVAQAETPNHGCDALASNSVASAFVPSMSSDLAGATFRENHVRKEELLVGQKIWGQVIT
jgi:hypothetical protein